MRLHFGLILSAVVVVVPLVGAFQPVKVGTGAASAGEWQKVGGGEGEKRDVGSDLHRLKIRRTEHPDDRTHPEIRVVRAANHATSRFRRRGIPGPDVDSRLAVRRVEVSLRRRGLLRERQDEGNRVATIGGGQTAPTTTTGRIAVPTPKTPDSLGVAQDGEDLAYFSEIKFGSKNKTFVLIIDTGSSDTWIPADTCRTRACRLHSTYGAGDSETLLSTGRTWDIRYGSGEVSGTVVSDTIRFAGFSLIYSFGLASLVSDDFVYFPIDGILGLGFATASQQQVPTIMDELVTQGSIKQKLFAVALSRTSDGVSDGVVNFGRVDSALFEGNINFSPSISPFGLWELKVDGATVDGEPIVAAGTRSAIIDTGTSLLLLPPADAYKLHSMIPDSQTNGEMFAIPCNTTVKIEFTFGSVTYRIPPADYVGPPVRAGVNICVSYISGRQILGRSTWLFGDVFLKNVYSVFDLDNNRVGFASRKKASPSPTTTPPKSSTKATSTTRATASGSSPTSGGGRSTGNGAPFSGAESGRAFLLSRSFVVFVLPCLLAVGAVTFL